MKSTTITRPEFYVVLWLDGYPRWSPTLGHKLNVKKINCMVRFTNCFIMADGTSYQPQNICFKMCGPSTTTTSRILLELPLVRGKLCRLRIPKHLLAKSSTLSLYWSGLIFLLKNVDKLVSHPPFDQFSKIKVQSLATYVKIDESEWFNRFSSCTNFLRSNTNVFAINIHIVFLLLRSFKKPY